MVSPIDYSINVESPFQSVLQGFKVGDFLQQRQVQQQQQQLAQQQAQQQAAAQAQMQSDLSALANNPNATGADYAGAITKYPHLSEQIKRGWDVLDTSQRQAKLEQMSQVHAALKSGKPQVAKDYLQTLLTAAQDGGDERTKAGLQALIQQIDIDPEATKVSTGISLIAQVGPEKYAEAYGKFGAEERAQEQAPFALAEQKSKAEQADYDTKIKAVKAKYADSEALLDLERKRWDITKITEDIAIQKEQNRIAALNSAISRETNQLKKQELKQKANEAKEARDEKIRTKVADAESAAGTIDNFLNTSDRVLKNPSLDSVLGTIQGRLPAVVSDEASDAIELIDTLGSQSFLSQIPSMKGLGSLTETEGKKLQASLTNLSRTQSRKQFEYNVKEAQRLMLKARKTLSEKTGVPLGAPDRPNAPRQENDFVPPTPGTPAPSADQKNITVDF